MERRLSIAEVADLYQISARTLRYYEEVGILKSHRKIDSKYREYDQEQCERLEIILLLRRLSFSMKMIIELLSGNDTQFRKMLNEKIMDSGKHLLEARETDRLLRDLATELSHKPIVALNTVEILSGYTYLTNKTERVIPMNAPQNEKYRVAFGVQVTEALFTENPNYLVEKIGILRSELEKESIVLPRIRLYDNADLPQTQVVVFWDGKEVWRKDFNSLNGAVCDEIITQLRLNCLKK